MPLIEKKLLETNQKLNRKKTKIDTAYHGVSFLGKVSYPYGFQKPTKEVIKRTCYKAKNGIDINDKNLISKLNSQIGSLKNYNCKRLILDYKEKLPKEVFESVKFNKSGFIFEKNLLHWQ